MFKKIKYSDIEILSLISIFLFLVSPVSQLLRNIKSYIIYDTPAIYYETIRIADLMAAFWGTVCIILLIGKMMSEKYKLKNFSEDNTPMIFFSVFILLMFISTFINGFTDYALYGEPWRHESIFNYIQYFCIYFFVTSLIKSEKIKKIIEYIFLAGSMILGVSGIIHINITPLKRCFSDADGLSTIFYNSNHYGYYLAMAVCLSGSLFILEKNNILKIFSFISYIINIYLLIINNTFGSYLAAFSGIIFNIIVLYICTKKINILSIVVLSVFIVESFIFPDNVINNILMLTGDLDKIVEENADCAGSGRWILWKTTVEAISEKPLFGFGTEGILNRLEATKVCPRSHNEFLQYVSFYGIPAGIMYVCGILSVFLRGLKYKEKLDCYTIAPLVAVFAYLVSSCFGNSFYYVTPFMFIFLGLGVTDSKKPNKK